MGSVSRASSTVVTPPKTFPPRVFRQGNQAVFDRKEKVDIFEAAVCPAVTDRRSSESRAYFRLS